jgi:threonine aldolase
MIDLRSDTVTQPTPAMRQAMATAELGDDVYGEDPTVNRLQGLAAEMLGKEAALLVTSGTQGNQIAVMTHCSPGSEVIIEEEAHIFTYEAGAAAMLSGVQLRTLRGKRGALDPADLVAAIREVNIHFPPTALLCLENTHNRAGGAVIPPEKMASLYRLARKHNIPVHLDGARIFNAAVALGITAKKLASFCDTVQICLSKGLAAPVGSLIAGPQEWIARARRHRKILGGGMRQAGIIAAPGIIALETMVDRLVEDHDNARFLAEELAAMPGLELDPDEVETNIVIAALTLIDATRFCEALRERAILINPVGGNRVRFTTHKDITRADLEKALPQINAVLKEAASSRSQI